MCVYYNLCILNLDMVQFKCLSRVQLMELWKFIFNVLWCSICRVSPHRNTDRLKDFLNTLVNEVINEECQLIARSAGREMATELLEKMAIYDVIMDMVTEEMLQTGDYIVGILFLCFQVLIKNVCFCSPILCCNQGRPSPKPMMHIAFSPYFHEIYKFSP